MRIGWPSESPSSTVRQTSILMGSLRVATRNYQEGSSLVEMIKEDLVAERIAVQSYAEIAHWLGEDDSTTRQLIEKILEMEEEHADDLANMLTKVAD